MATKIRASNLHTDVKTMVTTMVGENALDSAEANLLIDSKFTAKNTDNLSEGSSNLYFTNARADARAQLKVDAIVGSAPGTLDTLQELGDALGDDPNFATTVTNSIATKLPLVGGTLTGNLSLTSTASGSSASPELELRRDITGADANYLGQIKFTADNDADQNIVFAKITGKILDASDGTEDGIIEFAHKKAGSNNISARFRSDSLQLINGTNLTVAGTTELTGNVGIGTGSSVTNSTLNVNGGINITTGIIGYATNDAFTLNGRTQPHYGCNFTGSSGNPSGISGYYGISFAANGAEKMRIDSSGNVGIGTTGRIMSGYDGNSKTLTVYDPDGSAQSGYLELASMANNNGYNAGALVFINNANSNNSAPENANSKTVAQIRAETVTSDNNAGDDAGSDLCIFTKPEAGGLQRRMTIMGSGNVGIGTNSPQGLIDLTVSQAKTATSGATFARLGKTNEGSNYASLNCEIKGGASAADRKWSFQTVEQGVANAGSIVFQPDGGNVGIGTEGPGAKLSVSGPAALANLGGGSTGSAGLYVNTTSGHVGEMIQILRNNSIKMYMANDGDLALGHSSPSDKLDVQGADDGITIRSAANNRPKLSLINGSSTMLTLSANNIYGAIGDGSDVNRYMSFKDGKVGIGTTNPGFKLSVDNGTSDGGIFKLNNEEVGLHVSVNGSVGDYTNSTRMVVFNATRMDSGTSPKLRLGGQGGLEFAVDTNNVRMTIDSSGSVLVAKNSVNIGTAGHTFGASGYQHSTRNGNLIHLNQLDADGNAIIFMQAGATKGSVFVNSTGSQYNTTSDRRLKDNIQPISDATDKLMNMKPVTHTWIDNPDEPQVHGFIAQEMQEVVPEAVTGDAESDEMMSMDYGRITPVIVAALQDALNEIKELKTRINELENK